LNLQVEIFAKAPNQPAPKNSFVNLCALRGKRL
jgi:hypothetical protein